MTLYFLRHAIAMEKLKWRKADSDRPLTPEGIHKMKKAAKGIKRLNVHVDWILTSPFRRAYDTSMIVAKELSATKYWRTRRRQGSGTLKKNLRVIKSLAPEGDPKTLMRHLAQNFRTWESVMLVGHEPYLSELIGTLVSGASGPALQLDKGGLVKLSSDSLTYGKCAVLEWLLPPGLLKKLS